MVFKISYNKEVESSVETKQPTSWVVRKYASQGLVYLQGVTEYQTDSEGRRRLIWGKKEEKEI